MKVKGGQGKAGAPGRLWGTSRGFAYLKNKLIPRLFMFLLLLMSYAGMDKFPCMIRMISAISVLLCKYPQLIILFIISSLRYINPHLIVYRNKIEQTMDLTPNAISISKLLSQILSDAVTFNKRRHSKLIKLCKNI